MNTRTILAFPEPTSASRSRLLRRSFQHTAQSQSGTNLAAEFIETALFCTVAASMIIARSEARSVKLTGPVEGFLPRPPVLFTQTARAGHLDPNCPLTADMLRLYRQLDFALGITPSSDPFWNSHDETTDTWVGLRNVWQLLCGEIRLFLLVMAEITDVRESALMARLLEVEGLVKSIGSGGSPCVRADGQVLIPGWLDRRRGRRIPVGISVRVDCGRGHQRVTLSDISPTGAGLTSCPSLKTGSFVAIELPNGRRLEGHAAWSYANSIGIQFTNPIDDTDPVFSDILALRRSALAETK